jgi:predicted GIY-YIG superfamily endonuclease
MIDRFPEHAGRPHFVYRAFDAEGGLLYIGCTLDFERRRKEHTWHQPWANRIARWDVERYENQRDALLAEEAAIKAESPEFNAMYNGAGLTGWNDERRASETCLHGHPWSENAKVNAQGVRICRECDRIATWRHDAKRGRPYAKRKLAELELAS